MTTALTKVDCSIIYSRKLTPPQLNSIVIIVNTNSEEIFLNQTTGHQIRRPTTVSPPFLVNIHLRSSSQQHILSLLYDPFAGDPMLCAILAKEISKAALDLGFGHNGFTFPMAVTVTHHTVSVTTNDDEISQRTVLLGRMKTEELKSLKMETEPCSICLENLSGPTPSELTRMTCSHVFHDRCLLEWLKRKNTCPLCRTVLYDQ